MDHSFSRQDFNLPKPGLYISIENKMPFSSMFRVLTPFIDSQSRHKWLVLFDFNVMTHLTRDRDFIGVHPLQLHDKLEKLHHACMANTNFLMNTEHPGLDFSNLDSIINSFNKILMTPTNDLSVSRIILPIQGETQHYFKRIESIDDFDIHFKQYDDIARRNEILNMHAISHKLLVDTLNEYFDRYLTQHPKEITSIPQTNL